MPLPMESGSGPSVGSQMAFDSPWSLTHHRPELGSALLRSFGFGSLGEWNCLFLGQLGRIPFGPEGQARDGKLSHCQCGGEQQHLCLENGLTLLKR